MIGAFQIKKHIQRMTAIQHQKIITFTRVITELPSVLFPSVDPVTPAATADPASQQ